VISLAKSQEERLKARFARPPRVFLRFKNKPWHITGVQLLVIGETEGRPTKLDEPMAARICEALSYGLTNDDVADLVGIHVTTLYDWFKIEAFAKRVAGAKATRKLERLRRVHNGDSGWQSACWLLERSDPQLWGRHLLYQRAESEEKNVTEVTLVEALSNYNALKDGKAKEQVIEAQGTAPEPN
jgi:hypothetical protein